MNISSENFDPRQDKTGHVVVVGGGIAGLAAAYYLQKESVSQRKPLRITLIEAEDRVGGKIVTERIDGFTIEGGPDCFLRQKPWAAELAAEIGLSTEIIGTNPENRGVFVLNRGKLVRLPEGVMLIIPTRFMPFVTSPLISPVGKLRMGMDLFVPPNRDNGDESVASFVRRRLGIEALEKIAEPLLGGIHVSDPERQSLLATFPRFRDLEKKYGSLIRGMLAQRKNNHHTRIVKGEGNSLFLSFRKGLSELSEGLANYLRDSGCQLMLSCRVEKIDSQNGGSVNLQLSNGEFLKADGVIIAVPAFSAAEMIHAFAPQTAELLRRIDYVSTATISIAYRLSDISRSFTGYGFVVPRKEGRMLQACTWTSLKFSNRAPQDHLLLRCFLGGPGKEEVVNYDDNEILRIVRGELREIQKIDAEPVFSRIYRWRKGNPQYYVGHLELVQKIFETAADEMPRVVLTGSAYQGVGIPDCIHNARKSALALYQSLAQKE
ncbi:MAG: protoporphyrinogen oxidase [Chloroflexota bacterium]